MEKRLKKLKELLHRQRRKLKNLEAEGTRSPSYRPVDSTYGQERKKNVKAPSFTSSHHLRSRSPRRARAERKNKLSSPRLEISSYACAKQKRRSRSIVRDRHRRSETPSYARAEHKRRSRSPFRDCNQKSSYARAERKKKSTLVNCHSGSATPTFACAEPGSETPIYTLAESKTNTPNSSYAHAEHNKDPDLLQEGAGLGPVVQKVGVVHGTI